MADPSNAERQRVIKTLLKDLSDDKPFITRLAELHAAIAKTNAELETARITEEPDEVIRIARHLHHLREEQVVFAAEIMAVRRYALKKLADS